MILDYAGDCEVIRVGSNELVLQAEALLAGEKVPLEVIQSILAPFIQANGASSVDTIVLGCTHFPLVKSQLKAILPEVIWIDSGEAIAKRVHSLLEEKSGGMTGQVTSGSRSINHQIYFSKLLPNQDVFSAALAKLGFLTSDLNLLNIE